jgi:hypothetical protein
MPVFLENDHRHWRVRATSVAALGLTLIAAVALPEPAVALTEQHRAFVEQASRQLEYIQVEPEHRSGYDRDAWPHWIDADDDCLDARQEVLVAESLVEVTVRDCRVQAGVWYDWYTDQHFEDPGDLDVDHFVPLQEVHDSGGWQWTEAQRRLYANDLGSKLTLVAVSASANRSKAADGPEDWLPPNPEALCYYAAAWVAVKYRWELSMDERERQAVGNIIGTCRQR